jgi:hypothetical protein
VTDIRQRIANLPPEKRALLEQHLLRQALQKAASANGEMALAPRQASEPPPLSFAQQRLWFLHQLEPDSVQFNTVRATQIQGALNVEGLHWAFEQIVARHEAIRTVFTAVAEEPRQHILSEWSVELPVIDLTAVPPEEKAAQIKHYFQLEAERPFDLSRDLMMRVTLLRHTPTEHTLIMAKHHIASDAWSAGLFNRELAGLYKEFVAGRNGRAAPAAHSICRLCCVAAPLAGIWCPGASKLTYWQHDQLASSPPQLELPTDRLRARPCPAIAART